MFHNVHIFPWYIVQWSEIFTNFFQFAATLRRHLGVFHIYFFKSINNDLRDNQPGIFLVICRYCIPGTVGGACCLEAVLVSRHILRPESSFVEVGSAEFPVLFRFVDATEKTLPLLLFGEMQKYFDNPRAGTVEMVFKIYN